MHDDDITEALHEFTSGGEPAGSADLLSAVRRRRWRRRIAIFTGVMAVGLIAAAGVVVRGVLVADESPVAGAPRVSSADVGCGEGEQLQFTVNSWESRGSVEEISGDSPEAAVGPWLDDGQIVAAVSEDGASAQVEVADENGVTISVITLSSSKTLGWSITETTACADHVAAGQKTEGCGARVDLVAGRSYRALRPQPVLGPGAWIGQGILPECALWTTPDGTHARPRAGPAVRLRGPVGPVTLFRESEVPPERHAVIMIDDLPVLLKSTVS